jgi:hypothetical protein
MFPSTLKTLQDCAAVCGWTGDILFGRADAHLRATQMKYMRDCMDICNLCIKYMSSNSHFTKSIVNFCAYVCEVCANECFKFSDRESQYCGQICLNCARECRAFAMAA